MKVSRTKALKYIEDKLTAFEYLRTESNLDNRYGSHYKSVYYATESMIEELFSQDEVKAFRYKVIIPRVVWAHVPIDPEEALRDYRSHLDQCIVMLKAYKERIENFWEEDPQQMQKTRIQGHLIDSSIDTNIKEEAQPKFKGQGPNPRNVFVVHGRNLKIRDSMFDFLRALDLHPIEWNEAVAATGKATPFVGEILDAGFKKAQAVVVLLTPDDIGRLLEEHQKADDPPHERFLTPQARLNVIYEAGMAMGLYPDRTVIVEIGQLRPFSDNAGRHTVRLDNSPGSRNEFVQRLKVAGCQMNLIGNQWLTVGNFTVSESTSFSNEQLVVPAHLKPQTEESVLDDISVEILKLLVKDSAYSRTLARTLRIEEQRIVYSLLELEKGRYVFQGFYDAEYHLDQRGREYLIKRGLL